MKRHLVTLIVLALVAAACGTGDVGSAGPVTLPPGGNDGITGPTSTTVPSTTPPETGQDPTTTTTSTVPEPPDDATRVFVDVFFVGEGITAQPAVRSVETPGVAANALRALLEGPTAAERDQGLSTAIPDNTLLLGIDVADGVATVDLSREFEVGGGSMSILNRLAQVVYTLTQFPSIDAVQFRLDGEPVTVFSGEGVLLENPVDRSDYETHLPLAGGSDPGDGPERWTQADLGSLTGVNPDRLSRVVLVADTDVLNVREEPSPDARIVGMFSPDVIVARTGLTQVVGSSVWAQVTTPAGPHWVNSRFLGADVSPADFAADDRVIDLLEEFAAVLAAGGDLRPVVSGRGLYVAYNAAPILFPVADLAGILLDATTYQWPSNALAPDDPEFLAMPGRTFAEAVGESFLSAYLDTDTELAFNEWRDAASQGIPEGAIPVPFELRAFNYVGVHDPGDEAQYEGLDWIAWYVSIDYEDGEPRIVGLTIDTWEP